MALNITLKPNNELLNCNFEGYKLKPLDDQGVITKQIEFGIFQNVSEDATCYLYTRMESLHNKLFPDPYEENSVYLFNQKGHLLMYSLSDNFVSTPSTVYQEDLKNSTCMGDDNGRRFFSPSISFASSTVAISSNGRGSLSVFLTGDRNTGSSWLNVKYLTVLPGILINSLSLDQNLGSTFQQEIHVLLLSVASLSELEKESRLTNLALFKDCKSSLHVLHWLTFRLNGDDCELIRERKIVGSNSLDYASLDSKGESVILLCHANYSFVYDSIAPVKEISKGDLPADKGAPKYIFIQNNDEIKLHVNVGPDYEKADISIQVKRQSIKILIKGEPFLDKKFINTVDESSSTWTVDKGRIEVCIPKSQENVRWPRLFEETDVEGEEMLDESVLDEVHQRLSHLTSENWNPNPDPEHPVFNPSQLEACDDASEDLSLLILDGTSHLASHSNHLGTVQHLLNVTEKGNTIPCFCLRHDVDGLLWKMSEEREFVHVATFNAFGYVKASKTMAKFTSASPDFSYVAIADVKSHVYAFFQSDSIGGELRNRSTGRLSTQIGRQLVISLKNHDQIMGFHTASKAIFVLTHDHLFVYLLL